MRLFVLWFLVFISGVLNATERIRSFQSDIVIHEDAAITVTETITVLSEGRSIRHGIVREFPTHYTDRWGNSYDVRFQLKKVLLDKKTVPFYIRVASNGHMIYVGDPDRTLLPGVYTIVIEYTVQRVLGFFSTHDELYWNVTGTGWRLPIDVASAVVQMPTNVPPAEIHGDGYTGYQGSTEQQYAARIVDRQVYFRTTAPLAQQQGLTIVVTWPKGFVIEPTTWQELRWFLWDNKDIAIGFASLLFLLIFSLIAWVRFRRSQNLGTVIPLFYPPEHISPGHIRYFVKMKYDAVVLAADLVDMAVHGYITIEQKPSRWWGGEKSYTLHKKAEPQALFEGIYQTVANYLFAQSTTITLSSSYVKAVNAAITFIEHWYRTQTSTNFYVPISYLVWALLGVGFSTTVIAIIGRIFMTLLFGVIAVGCIGLFYALMRGYTKTGLAVKREIEGFKLFLSTVEGERLPIIGTPPTKTPELYETYLPYAIALEVEKQWAQQFAPLFAQMESEGHPHTMVWIGGPYHSFRSSGFASQINQSCVHSITASSTPPGRSSGFGGRGSSGGGGGGGGGGGW